MLTVSVYMGRHLSTKHTMTKYFNLIFFILPFSVIGQTKIDTTKIKIKNNFASQPAYFLDSSFIDMSKTYINLENIKSIEVSKDTFFQNGTLMIGKVWISSKNKTHNWATLGDIKIQKSIPVDTTLQKIYIIDGNLISDTTNVRIELDFIKSIDILNMANTKGIYHEGPPKTVIIVTTKHKKRKTKKSR